MEVQIMVSTLGDQASTGQGDSTFRYPFTLIWLVINRGLLIADPYKVANYDYYYFLLKTQATEPTTTYGLGQQCPLQTSNYNP